MAGRPVERWRANIRKLEADLLALAGCLNNLASETEARPQSELAAAKAELTAGTGVATPQTGRSYVVVNRREVDLVHWCRWARPCSSWFRLIA